MDLLSRIESQFGESARLLQSAAEVLAGPIAGAAEMMVQSLLGNGKILVCGNGASAAAAQHFAAKMMARFERERPQLAVLALSADNAVLTALSNAYSFRQAYAKQVATLGQPGDVLLVISSSGRSDNVLDAIEAAQERDMHVVALTGRHGGRVAELLREEDVHICVPHERPARIQEVHVLAIHCLCDGIDCLLMGEEN
ncbi:phosphoheptose isomerase [Uliginosibacterium sediminicola]|uniref:Phosphoheptose isomerase n=1 Tax=Uliginosibacterium sediminicola TaxID=2024550 RepID=A0ABU9YWW2_9RHOO